jgi:hypothetical protein
MWKIGISRPITQIVHQDGGQVLISVKVWNSQQHASKMMIYQTSQIKLRAKTKKIKGA